jgi:3-phosphoinositide dependent protein kinase-1
MIIQIDFATCKIIGKMFNKISLKFENIDGMTINTFLGTANYLSPEMLNNGSIGFGTDIWSLGIILYEMLHGYPPFVDKTDYLTFQRISELKFVIDNVNQINCRKFRKMQKI